MRLRKRGLLVGLSALVLLVDGRHDSAVTAPRPQTRTISFKHIHTNEQITVVYKKDGAYVPEAMAKINWLMRDWRKNAEQKMDPEVIDLLWEMHTELGSNEPIHVICGFRTNETNDMLRRTVGGQASQSQHISGKAIDVTFPDVPLKRLRYSALVRERGGVGYYPTSGIPFVHVDTASVRHWPRLPRHELALLFPHGQTRYMPADGGPISKADVAEARSLHKDLAQQIASFLDERSKPKATVAVADASGGSGGGQKGAQPAFVTASLGPVAMTRKSEETPAPRLVTEPRLIERSTPLSTRPALAPSQRDKDKLTALVEQAAFSEPAAESPKLVALPRPAQRPAGVGAAGAARVAALEPARGEVDAPRSLTDAISPASWVPAPAYDEEHPDELSYRPFPVAPMLTDSASADDPALVRLQHPDTARTLELIDDRGAILPMRLRPGLQTAQLPWAQQFSGKSVGFAVLDQASGQASPLTARKVRTSSN